MTIVDSFTDLATVDFCSTPLVVAKTQTQEDEEVLGSLLAEARKRAGLTQVALANQLGHKQAYVSKYELGQRRLSVTEFLEIVRVLNINLVEILRAFEKLRLKSSKRLS